MEKKDWEIKEDPILNELNKLTLGKLNSIEGARNGGFTTKGRKASKEESERRSEAQKGLKKGV